MTAYLDNSATTQPCGQCIDKINEMLQNNFGNPSSLHALGLEAHRTVEKAREALANSIGAEDKNQIFFTSGGTEANNLAIFGSAYANRRKGNRIVTTAIEHESVLESINQLEKEGFEIVKLVPNIFGEISTEQIRDAINSNTILVSIMLVNNEVGSIMPISEIKKAVKAVKAPANIHVDAVQAYGKIPVKVQKLNVDLLTVTAHKIHGTKGIGALYIKKGTPLTPRIFGGEQEKRIRPGTEASPLIAGFGGAIEALPVLSLSTENVTAIRDYTLEMIKNVPEIRVNSGANASPYIVNMAIAGIRSQTLIQDLSSRGVYVSNGSACAKGKKSHVLTAMGLPSQVIDSSIRLSFSRFTTKDEIDLFVSEVKKSIEKLAKR